MSKNIVILKSVSEVTYVRIYRRGTYSKFPKYFMVNISHNNLERYCRLFVVPFDILCMVSYKCSIVTLSLKRTVFVIFDFKSAVTLKTGLGVRQGY